MSVGCALGRAGVARLGIEGRFGLVLLIRRGRCKSEHALELLYQNVGLAITLQKFPNLVVLLLKLFILDPHLPLQQIDRILNERCKCRSGRARLCPVLAGECSWYPSIQSDLAYHDDGELLILLIHTHW